ncbi:MAG: shikimate dehydrogenase [Omnitrophica bacterium]|nr:shikimate dehydrogenase [Candidatus Omnitrophota bacterium]
MNKDSSTDLYGLIGYPVKHSLSPAMHNAAFKAKNINAEYRLFEIKPQDLEDFLLKPDKEIKDTNSNTVWAEDIKGFNITIPHKVRAKEILDNTKLLGDRPIIVRDEYIAAIAGAINTVKKDQERIYYTNTDARGFLRSLKEDLQFTSKDNDILLIGCGGAGRAVVAGLSGLDRSILKKVHIYEINEKIRLSASEHFSQISHLDGRWEFISQEQIPEAVKKCQLLINASPVGMKDGDQPVIDIKLLRKDLFVYDVVYNRETKLVKEARLLRAPATGGLGMLLYQGVVAWELWTGQKAPVDVMRQALEKELNK